jgi:6-phospho-3-hexuloisomerase
MSDSFYRVADEIVRAVSGTNLNGYEDFLGLVNRDGSKIICTGAGRVGLGMRGFTMRLSHLGLNAYFLGETIVPHTGKGDLLLVGSGSGRTSSVLRTVEIAKSKQLNVGLITASIESPMSTLSNACVVLNTPNKMLGKDSQTSIQPMTTLFEQTLAIFLDSVVLDLMKKFNENSETMWERHNAIE